MDWPIDRERLLSADRGVPRYELIAKAIEGAIIAGRLRTDERLPTVRQLAEQLGVSGTTVSAAYHLLSEKDWIRSAVGRGTFVTGPRIGGSFVTGSNAWEAGSPGPPTLNGERVRETRQTFSAAPWRRRALMSSASRLRAAYPKVVDCSTGRPDPTLLPLELLQTAWKETAESTRHADLQYAGPEAVDSLRQALLPRLALDRVAAENEDLVVASSAQELMVLTLEVISALSGHSQITIAVENPGYPTIFDTFERAGYRLIGIDVDAFGAVPASLDAAVQRGATAVLLTPRAHNPTGASWSVERAADLAQVLAEHRGVVAIEDDHFAGITTTRAGSLLGDRRIEERVVYIRSFSKSIAPDLRIAVAVARPRLRTLLSEAKSFADGWTSRAIQRTLALVLGDSRLDELLSTAARAYAERRTIAAKELHNALAPFGGSTWSGTDGVNIWVHLPPGTDSFHVIEKAGSLGVLIAPGEPFFIRPGRGDVLRINVGAVGPEQAGEVGRLVGQAAMTQTATVHAIPV
ncbi:MAG: PLP-dependent aminotransferase family protein [Acidobacteriota bacterium]